MIDNKPIIIARAFLYLGLGAIVAAVVIAFYFIYLLFFPFKVIDIKSPQDLPITKKVYNTDEQIGFVYDYCKQTDVAPRTAKELISENNVISLSPTSSDLPRVGESCGKVTIYHEIPDYTPSGKYRLYIFAAYPVNSFRTIDYTFRTQEFEIKNSNVQTGEEEADEGSALKARKIDAEALKAHLEQPYVFRPVNLQGSKTPTGPSNTNIPQSAIQPYRPPDQPSAASSAQPQPAAAPAPAPTSAPAQPAPAESNPGLIEKILDIII